ncbi:hypothetical protein EYF80_026856 [Liparis tanakae]|uniref:Uncharacterized protein n=1 Tax=Liparis tanakae TaxID=230148 RepID=A0A4Z2HDE0_9TELE|nr:hypothetical protein EYF80_026856 [Liparis tanakae]
MSPLQATFQLRYFGMCFHRGSNREADYNRTRQLWNIWGALLEYKAGTHKTLNFSEGGHNKDSPVNKDLKEKSSISGWHIFALMKAFP